MKSLAVALALLTRFPVFGRGSGDAKIIGRSLLWYPVVGAIIGIVLWGVAWISTPAHHLVGAALVLAAWCTLTGGLHLDGLCDSTDALIGSHGNPARALDIMKDPSAGPMGVAAVCVTLIVKFAGIGAIIAAGAWWLLVMAPVLGRVAVMVLFLTTPYVRPGGLGDSLSTHAPRAYAWTVAAAAVTILLLAGGVFPLLGALIALLILRRLMLRSFGGTTGDTAGAVVEVSEAVALIAVAP